MVGSSLKVTAGAMVTGNTPSATVLAGRWMASPRTFLTGGSVAESPGMAALR
jgi:hypothetical protein